MRILSSINILPMLATTDQRNKRFRHSVFGGDGALRHSRQGSDCYYISRAQFCASATSSVLSLVNRLKMRGIDTAPVAAKMVKLQAVRDWTYELFVDPTVRRVVNPSACNLTVSRLRQTAVPIPASGGRINRVRCVDIGLTELSNAGDLRFTTDESPVVSSEEATRRETAAAAATWKQYRGLRPELVISGSGASAAASVFRLREVSAALNALLGTIGVHVTAFRDVPCRRVPSAPLRLSVLSEQLYQAGGALCR